MQIGYGIRKLGFYIQQKIKGNPVLNQVKDIEKKIQEGNKLQEEELKCFLEYATLNVAYYKQYKGSKSIEHFPVIQKKDVKDNYKDFLAQEYSESDVVKIHTSGSYGVPFEFKLTKNKKYRQWAEVIFFGRWAHYDIGVKHSFIRATNDKSKIKLFIQNEHYSNPVNLTEAWKENERRVLKNKKIECIIGVPSAISALAQYCLEKGDKASDFNIKGVITSAEALLPHQREAIKKAFNCKCVSRYATEEFGILAHECSEYNNHHLNMASFYIEILEINTDNPAKQGEVGRIVVTDLYSHAMPLIRYDTGDLGIIEGTCRCGRNTPILKEIKGRTVETIYKPNGEILLPSFINPIMSKYTQIKQYQFIQEDKESYKVKIVYDKLHFEEEEKLNKELRNWLGEHANIVIEIVADIEKLPSGKRPYVINKYINN